MMLDGFILGNTKMKNHHDLYFMLQQPSLEDERMEQDNQEWKTGYVDLTNMILIKPKL